MPRFYFRNAVAILTPTLVTAYFVFIWRYHLQISGPVLFGPRGGLLIFYSWFVISTLGLNITKHGMEGVEAAMLMEPPWAAENAMQLMAHCEHSWSGPAGWIALAKSAILYWTRKQQNTAWPSKTWSCLALLSVSAFVAIPISGLCMEPSDGYVLSDEQAYVVGKTYDNFNVRLGDDPIIRATIAWMTTSTTTAWADLYARCSPYPESSPTHPEYASP